jgi:hypothetical protein
MRSLMYTFEDVIYGYDVRLFRRFGALAHSGTRRPTHQNTTRHNIKHNNTQQYTTFSRESPSARHLFSTTYVMAGRPVPACSQGPLRAANCRSRKMQGGLRSLRHNPNRHNGSSVLFFGDLAFHCTWKRPYPSNFEKIEGRKSIMAGQVIDDRHFPGLPGGLLGVCSGFWREIEFAACRLCPQAPGASPQ